MTRAIRRRPVRGLVLAALAVTATAGHPVPARAATPAITAGDLGYPYPNAPDCDEQTGANCVADEWGFVQGQCHSWVAYRLNELNATELGGVTFDDHYRMPAGHEWGSVWRWNTAAQEAGVPMDDSPALGSLAWWSADGGHVAYVEAVNGDGSIQISEMNADYHNGFDFATLTPSGRWPDKFIHVADRPPARTTTSFSIAANGGASASVSRGTMLTLSESGLPSAATGSVGFSAPDDSSLCAITLPTTSCDVVGGLPVGSYAPITATFTPSDSNYATSSSSNSVSVEVAPVVPSAPRSVGASVSAHTATVKWSAPGDDGGAAIADYVVTLSPGNKKVSVAGTTTEASFANLVTGTYQCTVTAANSAGTGPASAAATAVVVAPVAKPQSGYWMLGAGGQVYAFGDAKAMGNAPGPVVAMTARRDGRGYWTVDARGSVHAFGAAVGHGGDPALRAGEAVSTIAATTSGNGYWLFTNQGRVVPFGDAHFFGDMAKVRLNGPVIASAATATGKGYYMVGSDGGVFTFGDARFHGSTGAMMLNRPIAGIAPTPDNKGYWLVASDGGVFAFGARFRGSMGSAKLNKPVNGLVVFGNGYLIVASDGGIFDFSNKKFSGSLGGRAIPKPIVGVASYSTD